LGGDAGTGKSAVLRRLSERQRERGAGLLVLKHDRLTARTWAEHAASTNLQAPLAQVVAELAAGGSGVLVLDGYDRMVEAEPRRADPRGVRRDQRRPHAGRSGGASSRAATQPAPESALDLPLLKDAVPWNIGVPDDDDLSFLAKAFPHLADLMSRRGYADLNRNLFFIDQMARNPSVAGASSELDLMQAWARRGANETPRHPTRDATLRSLGEQRLVRPFGPLPKPADEDGIARLASERTLDLPAYRDVLTFAHDIYEDWAVARALDARRSEIPAILLGAGQPLSWMRALRLAAEIALETTVRPDGGAPRPPWRRGARSRVAADRAHGAAPLAAGGDLLDGLEPTLLEDGGRLLADLVDTLLALEVRPIPSCSRRPSSTAWIPPGAAASRWRRRSHGWHRGMPS
jgi:hypothetical protein